MTFIVHRIANYCIHFECYIIFCRKQVHSNNNKVISSFRINTFVMFIYIVLYVMKFCIKYHDNPSAREKYSLICFIK